MSAGTKWTIDDAQFNARNALKIIDDVLGAIRETGRSYQDRVLYQNLSEAREELARARQILEYLNPNGRNIDSSTDARRSPPM
jgi:hypothetical protein